jgi:hypothetical protein
MGGDGERTEIFESKDKRKYRNRYKKRVALRRVKGLDE